MNPPADTLAAPEAIASSETASCEDLDSTASEATVTTTDVSIIEDELLVEEISIDGMCGVY